MPYDAVNMADRQISEAAEKNMPTVDEWQEKLGLDDCMKVGLQIPVLREEARGLSQEIMARASLRAIRPRQTGRS